MGEFVQKYPWLILAVIGGMTIGFWLASKKLREEYGVRLMSRWMGAGLLLGLMIVTAATIQMACMARDGTLLADRRELLIGVLCIVGGTALSILCCLRVLREYPEKGGFGMIARLLVVGVAVYLLASWIVAVAVLWLAAKAFRRRIHGREYIIIED